MKTVAVTRTLLGSVRMASTVSPGASLDDWRRKGTIDVKTFKNAVFGGEGTVEIRNEVWTLLERDPLFRKENRVLSMDEYRELNHRRWKRIVEMNYANDPYGEYEKYSGLVMCLDLYDQGLGARLALHAHVFMGAVRSMGTERHNAILEQGARNEIVGCFCLTELSHGSNTQQIQTTATYDKGEIVLNTPHNGAMKVWAGNLALSATHAVVFAQLSVGGENVGVHGFVLRIRDERTHRSLPGITIGDMGPKPGQWNSVENGWMVFKNHRAPLESLLNRGCDIVNGKYVHSFKSDRDKRSVSLGALSIGRIGIVGKGVMACMLGATVAVRYSAIRKQFGPPGKDELPVLSYPLQRRRLLPYMASAVTMAMFHTKLVEHFATYMARVMSGEKSDELAELSKEVHGLSSCCKPRATWIGMAALSECRAACGGHGFLFSSRLNEMRDSFDPMQTFEGENNILVAQASNYLLSQRREGITKSPMGSIDFLSSKPSNYRGWNSDVLANIGHAYEWLLWHLLEKTEGALAEGKARGVDGFTLRNETQIDLAHPLALAYAELVMFRWALDAVNEEDDATCRRVLARCVELFGLNLLQAHLATLYVGGYCSGPEFSNHIKQRQVAVEAELAPEAARIVDAIAPPDFAVGSVLGTSDGRAYENLVAELESRREVRASFADDLVSTLAQNRAKAKL